MSSKRTKAAERAERAAALLAEQKRKERRRNVLAGVGVALVIVLVVGAGFAINKLRDDGSVTASDAGSSDFSLVVGDADPSEAHQLVVYEDFLCPICGEFEAASHEKLAALAEEGKVVIDYRPISILGRMGPYSPAAANAFFVVQDAAGDEVAKKFHDLLYADQPSEQGPFPDDDWLVDKAVEAGADEDAVRDGIENGEFDDKVEQATQEASDAGVDGTPTILLDGEQFQEGKTFEDLANKLAEKIEEPVE